ncbi:MAG: TonB-dependent receptor, partial [Bacteroidales bacterium]
MIKGWTILAGWLGLALAVSAQEPAPRVSFRLDHASFRVLAETLHRETGVTVYYKEAWVEGMEVTMAADSMDIGRVMDQVLVHAGLHFQFMPPDRIIVLPERDLVTDLSYLTGKGASVTNLDPGDSGGTASHGYLRATRPEQLVETIVVGNVRSGTARTAARIRGRITDQETGEPVIGATMVLTGTGKGSVSDQTGTVTMSLLPGRYEAQFSFIGMEKYRCFLEVRSDGEFRILMQPAVISLNEVQIVGNQYRNINTTDVGVERLSMKTLDQMPLFMGENDVIKISRLLPGITSAGEASSGVNVRGGSADQNLFYINRVPIYNTSHMFGFLSAFNSDIIHDFSVYKGNVPVNYGGRLSSVFNIVTRKGNRKAFTAHAGISPVSAHATVEGPLVKERVSLLVSGRSSYSDWILKRIEDPLLRESSASFYDISAVLDVNVNSKNDLSGFYYGSADRFAYGEISEYEYANQGGSLSWRHTYSPALSSNVTAALSAYSFGTLQNQEPSQAYRHRYQLAHNEVIGAFTWVPFLNHHIDFGGGAIYYALDRGKVLPADESSLRDPVDLGRERGVEGNLFVSDNITLLPWLTLYAGLRYSLFTNLGPADVRRYAEGEQMTDASVTDTVHYGRGEPVSFNSGPEVRTALNIRMGSNTSLKFSFSQMRQYLFMLSNTVTISPTDQWKLADYYITPPKGYQLTAGIHRIWTRTGISGSVELYYKETEHVVEFRDGASFVGSPFTETAVLQGTQQAYG